MDLSCVFVEIDWNLAPGLESDSSRPIAGPISGANFVATGHGALDNARGCLNVGLPRVVNPTRADASRPPFFPIQGALP